MFLLIDCNNFYASCERVFRPDLRELAIVVLSNNDGCVIARSNEAKALGIPMGAPAFKYADVFAKNNVQVFSANFALYGDMSNRVMNIAMSYAPESEIYSIDEAFLLLKGHDYIDLEEYGKGIRSHVLRATGIPVSVGIAPTKTLAKTANNIAKKFYSHTGGVYSIDSDEKRTKALAWLPISDVWGIGRRFSRMLQSNGIVKAADFVKFPDSWVKKQMSVAGLRVKKELLGEACFQLESEDSQQQRIAVTRTFEKDYELLDDIIERVSTFAVSAAEKLRKQSLCCNAILVFMYTNYHKSEKPQYSQSLIVRMPFATNSSIDIVHYARIVATKIFKKGYAYKKAGIVLLDLVTDSSRQLSLFEMQNPKHDALMKSMDSINKSMGKSLVRLATQSQGRVWKMKQEHLSPAYTTSLKDVITVRAK
ncbi:MAG: Y-family DNA polymerase [Bacteroidales bacterium]|jgi:DNA polymerase V|nr:Y-family DNA polymerase [Bacteroidales bacterium]